ncbi:hypothetical protein [Persicitalea jodogahamensis]|uniref:Uncharacterized protein n=1 Tax=Persicitalea jodogahamensis TaxID=402147 RepID=A0A8J3DA56_9BACT|nr:hypothetical protein [Persicitalea jodogahamensis]GHB74916.1 hypothetical protein GCM10007390_30750 [Persicitalea jodogahamensis]
MIRTSRETLYYLVILFLMAIPNGSSAQAQLSTVRGKSFNSITLEASLKPFKKNDQAYIRDVAKEMFTQWQSLLRHADTVSVMLWTGDGSEILDYKGAPGQPLEWARYLGNPNTQHEVGSGPEELSIHERAYLYMENPPVFTYGDLAFIIKTLKEEGKKVTGKPILVGATFDPGPEFAKSEFKYVKHPEILGGNAMGHKSFVSCYSVLNADQEAYAGFPKGIPENTPFGTFFGRQSQHFLKDLGYDYIWLSNGFGFGAEGWSATGATFNGKEFHQEKLAGLTAKINEFWQLFRKECPKFQIQTRGTNLSVGADLARDAVNLKQIYEGGYNMLPPPNSPWAALDGDFGLEMVGYMSRMAELPDNRFLFRYYTHDPWWLNSPWLDRYGREPHDIYLPMSVSRIDKNGKIGIPTHLDFLTIDNSLGEMPTQVPDEVTPHILKARYDAPTAPGPLVWVYPFDEYHQWAYNSKDRLPEVYYGDWYVRQAINNGLPLNTVISTTSFQSVIAKNPGYFNESTLLTIAPDAGSSLEKALIGFVEKGGRLIIFGPTDHSSPAFLDFLNQKNESPLEGEFNIKSSLGSDALEKESPALINHRSLFSGGGFRTVLKNRNEAGTKLLAQVEQSGKSRDAVWVRSKPEWRGGKVAYLRGTNASSFTGGRLLTPDDPEEWFIAPLQLRYVLPEFGISHFVEKQDPSIKNPVITISRSNNAFIFSGYNPNSTVRQHFRFPQGAPLLLGLETKLNAGQSSYTMPTAWNRECRVFVEQNQGIVSFKEQHSGQKGVTKRYSVGGLKNATVRIYAEEGITRDQFHAYMNSSYPWKTGQVTFKQGDEKMGNHFVVENVTGTLVVSW